MAAFRFVVLVCAVVLAVWVLLIPDAIIRIVRERKAISEIETVWKKVRLGRLLLTLGAFCVVVGWWLPIPSGYAITGIAVIAGIMALRPEMGGWERSLWFIVLVFFAAMEIRAINRDRKDQAGKFDKTSASLQTTINNGQTAVDSLKTATNALAAIIETTQELKKNTEPYAYVRQYSLGPDMVPGVPMIVAETAKIPFDVWFGNTGTDTAMTMVYDAKIYLGNPKDSNDEKRIDKNFDEWWANPKKQGAN